MADEKRDDGGSAFPGVIERPAGGVPGMTLRDWFAGQAIVGVASSQFPTPRMDAELAYRIADAMLEVRSR